MLLENVRNAMIHGCRSWQEIETFLRVEGRESHGIVLLANDLSLARKAFEISGGAPAGAVVSK